MSDDTTDPLAEPSSERPAPAAAAEPVILIDADACPVKDEVHRVASRHGLAQIYVSDSWMRLPDDPRIERVIVPTGPDAADDRIAERARPGAVVITADVPLAHRCILAGARVITPRGRILDAATIGPVLATRDLLADLRSAGMETGGPRPFAPRDRQVFLQALEREVRLALRLLGRR